MAHKTMNPKTSNGLAIPIVLFGVDGQGKPKAARFLDKHADLATKAAGQLKLQVLKVQGPETSDLAAKLPQGRIHANGRGFIPFIRRDLYNKLLAAASAATGGGDAAPSSPTSQGGEPGRPGDWDSIAIGHVVVVLDEPGEGWYEAIVAETHGDMLTLRWRDYPRERRFVRHRLSVGLLFPGGDPTALLSVKSTTGPTPKPKATSAEPSSAKPTAYPKSWADIDLDSLVLAKEDGPWRSWWEAVPVAKADQTLTLRWRDFAKLAPINRPRLDLALLYPNGRSPA